jgi:hypothetical protein
MIFSSIFVLAFGIFCLLFGGFTAYFGTGKSRNIGGALMLFGLIGLIIVIWFTGMVGLASPVEWESDVVVEALVAVVAAIIGGGASLVIFLGAIMKS